MEFEQILELIDHVSDSKVTSFQYEGNDVKISMKCGQTTKIVAAGVDMIPQAAMKSASSESIVSQTVRPEDAVAEKTAELSGNIVKSPLVGTFYAAPAEDAPPFVKVGDKVKKGQVLGIVEAMKLMNEIESDFDGEIAEVYVENGKTVEYGSPLFRIA